MTTLVERIASFLKDRDENVLPEEATDEERKASAESILKLMRKPTPTLHAAANKIAVYYDDFSCGDGNVTLGTPSYPEKFNDVWASLIEAELRGAKQ
ncbi:hypothetical protein [Agrobacterium sp. MS2]|uniref:hypothetical protein n=1 Tax=Agrobacterium sp. MS2 TaxID=1345498 RepID=UPI000DBF88BF|nr:hypothetical protein [Agrobacterium sp. MS2]RAL98708.1 hypothetical protein DOU54_06525 [Agrobacterium sp. MS2]